MSQFNILLTGYEPAVLALVFVAAYFILAALFLSAFEPANVIVPRYEPPHGASPGVAGWLFERGNLARAIAAALVDMAAQGYLQIEQRGDLYSVTQLGPDVSLSLEPEEDALARTLFKGYDCFDFDDASPQLKSALDAFTQALTNTGYFSRRIVLSLPAWIASGLGLMFVLFQSNYLAHSNRGVTNLVVLAFGCFVVAIRTLPETLGKIFGWLPGSTAPRRPWSSSDSMTFTLLLAGLGGIAVVAILSTTTAALLAAAFLGLNAVFFHALQGPTSAGRKIMAELTEYKKFLEEVEADAISRMNSCETAPSEFTQKQAYAIAFHLDRGWGEQFVGCVADLVERAEVFSKILRPRDSET